MKLKNLTLLFVALFTTSMAFAIPAPQEEDDPIAQLMATYGPQLEQLAQTLDTQLLPPLKRIAQLAQQAQQNNQADLTPEQSQALDQDMASVDTTLDNLVNTSLQGVDMAQALSQYEQNAAAYNKQIDELIKQYGEEAVKNAGYQKIPEKITEEQLRISLKMNQLQTGIMYLSMTNKLTQQEATLLVEIFFLQEDSEQGE